MNKMLAYTAILLLGGCGLHLAWEWEQAGANFDNRREVVPQLSIAASVSSDDLDMNSRWPEEAEQRLRQEVARISGAGETRVASRAEYAKDIQDYQAKANINFETGVVAVETVNTLNPVRSLKEAIVSTALTPGDYRRVDLYADRKDPPQNGDSLLYDQEPAKGGRSSQMADPAQKYAGSVIHGGVETRHMDANGKSQPVLRMRIPLDKAHLPQKARRYKNMVSHNAERFGLGEHLLYAIAKTESSFNPMLVSSARAYGLMQVVPGSAGVEVRQHLTGQRQKPSPKFLLDPANSIEYGAAYLHILAKNYFGEIRDPASRELCTIAAYNGGPGSVMRIFGKDKERAIKAINGMTPKEVYRRLITRHPATETRQYVDKVLKNLNLYTAKS